MSQKNLQGRLDGALKQVDLWMQENEKKLSENSKLEKQDDSPKARNDMPHAEAASKKGDIEVHKIELKHETVFLRMKREVQQVNNSIWLEREKAKMNMK